MIGFSKKKEFLQMRNQLCGSKTNKIFNNQQDFAPPNTPAPLPILL